MSIGTNIKNLRLYRGMTQSQFAKLLGVSDKAVSSWENDTKVPRMGIVEKISQIFGISKSVILDDENNLEIEDIELFSYLEELKNREELRMLFSLAKGATKEDVLQAVKIIEALQKED
jgi:transcriptional regulator with XRE-family HTH domain